MSDSAVALSIISGVVLAGAMLGFLAGAHQRMNFERWTTGERGFGAIFMY